MRQLFFISLHLLLDQAKENLKVKDAFELLVKKIINKNPNAGLDGDGDGGIFGGGKADR